MAGYYDPNKDYSKAIEAAKAAGQDTTKLEQERQNKIADKYGGKEPTMYGSDKTYSQLSGSNGSWKNQDTIKNAIRISNSGKNDSIRQQMEQAAQEGDWDKVGSLSNELAVPDGRYGGQDMAYAKQVLGEVAKQYGYDSDDYYNKRYDQVHGAGASAVFDATGGGTNTAGQWSGSGLASGMGSDASQYLRDMYAQQIAAQQADLKATYEKNLADNEAQDDLISDAYQRQKNQAAAQNDLQRMQMNEYGITRGLNTGASGQMALAQSAALQGSLAQLGSQEAQSLAENALARQNLSTAYRNAVDQAAADGNYQLASALYNEYVRQQEADRAQANWEAQFNYQKEQDSISAAAEKAALLAGFGDFSGYKALGYSDAQIAMMQNAWNAQYGTPAVGTTGTKPTENPGYDKNPGYDNGGLTADQVKALQNYYGVTADGAWGKNSTSAAGGMTAAQAWEQFTAPVTDVSQLSANGIAVANSMARGYTTGTQQRDSIISAYENGRITQGEAAFLAKAVGVTL